MEKNYDFTGYNSFLKPAARELRKAMTPQERRLWYCFLREYPVRFQRQRIIERFIADFYCSAAKLVIEIDGAHHFTVDGKEYDQIRTDILKRYGLAVLRFTNAEVAQHFREVCIRIDSMVQRRIRKA